MSHAKHAEPKHHDEKAATGLGAAKKKLRTGVKAGMEADIVSNDLGPDNVQKKHVANIKWTP